MANKLQTFADVTTEDTFKEWCEVLTGDTRPSGKYQAELSARYPGAVWLGYGEVKFLPVAQIRGEMAVRDGTPLVDLIRDAQDPLHFEPAIVVQDDFGGKATGEGFKRYGPPNGAYPKMGFDKWFPATIENAPKGVKAEVWALYIGAMKNVRGPDPMSPRDKRAAAIRLLKVGFQPTAVAVAMKITKQTVYNYQTADRVARSLMGLGVPEKDIDPEAQQQRLLKLSPIIESTPQYPLATKADKDRDTTLRLAAFLRLWKSGLNGSKLDHELKGHLTNPTWAEVHSTDPIDVGNAAGTPANGNTSRGKGKGKVNPITAESGGEMADKLSGSDAPDPFRTLGQIMIALAHNESVDNDEAVKTLRACGFNDGKAINKSILTPLAHWATMVDKAVEAEVKTQAEADQKAAEAEAEAVA